MKIILQLLRLNTKTKRFANREIVQSPIQLRFSNRKRQIGVDRAQYQTRNNLTLLFHSRVNLLPLFSLLLLIVTKLRPNTTVLPSLANSNDHLRQLRRLRQRHHHLLVLPPPLTHPISLALSPAITGQLAQYIPTYLRRGAPRLGLIGNGPIFGISAHSLRDPPPR